MVWVKNYERSWSDRFDQLDLVLKELELKEEGDGPRCDRRLVCLRIAGMAYDEELAARIRGLIGHEAGLTEQKMFGGLAFLLGGNMAIAASGEGGVLVRVDPDRSDELLASSNARVMEMRGRQMAGWLRVDLDDVRTESELARWVDLGTAYARSLPAKK